jgi:hypothetical protein
MHIAFPGWRAVTVSICSLLRLRHHLVLAVQHRFNQTELALELQDRAVVFLSMFQHSLNLFIRY